LYLPPLGIPVRPAQGVGDLGTTLELTILWGWHF